MDHSRVKLSIRKNIPTSVFSHRLGRAINTNSAHFSELELLTSAKKLSFYCENCHFQGSVILVENGTSMSVLSVYSQSISETLLLIILKISRIYEYNRFFVISLSHLHLHYIVL